MMISNPSRLLAVATAGILSASVLLAPTPAHAAKAKTYKYGAVALGVLGGYLLSKGKTVEGAVALGAGAYSYKKGEDTRKADKYDNYGNRYGYNNNGDNNGDRYGYNNNSNNNGDRYSYNNGNNSGDRYGSNNSYDSGYDNRYDVPDSNRLGNRDNNRNSEYRAYRSDERDHDRDNHRNNSKIRVR